MRLTIALEFTGAEGQNCVIAHEHAIHGGKEGTILKPVAHYNGRLLYNVTHLALSSNSTNHQLYQGCHSGSLSAHP